MERAESFDIQLRCEKTLNKVGYSPFNPDLPRDKMFLNFLMLLLVSSFWAQLPTGTQQLSVTLPMLAGVAVSYMIRWAVSDYLSVYMVYILFVSNSL